MTTDEFSQLIRNKIKENPDLVIVAIHALHLGVLDALKAEKVDRLDWETVAISALDARLFKSNKNFIAGKLEKLKPRAASRLDYFIERLRK